MFDIVSAAIFDLLYNNAVYTKTCVVQTRAVGFENENKPDTREALESTPTIIREVKRNKKLFALSSGRKWTQRTVCSKDIIACFESRAATALASPTTWNGGIRETRRTSVKQTINQTMTCADDAYNVYKATSVNFFKAENRHFPHEAIGRHTCLSTEKQHVIVFSLE